MEHVIHPFDPVWDSLSRTLILGSFPSVKSREQMFFYGHPRNRFWQVIAACFHEPVPSSIDEKKYLLHLHHLALWDVIQACDIVGSADSSIKNAIPTDILRITKSAPIDRIICNGSLSARLYHQHLFQLTGIPAISLPSTSPANAAWSLDKLIEAWQPYIQP